MLNFTNIDFDQLFGFNDNTNPIMMLVWILPIILFVFYGQRIQLQITSGEIKKSIKKLETYKNESKKELLEFIKTNSSEKDLEAKIDKYLEYFTIMPVDMDPNGIVGKVQHIVRTREDFTRLQVESIYKNGDKLKITQTQTLLEIATSLNMIYKIINHLFLTAKKQNNYPLILPLQMMLPFIMEESEAMRLAIPAFKKVQPIGDGIGPMIVGKMMLATKKENAAFETLKSEINFEDRKLVLLKAEGPNSTVGRPADAVQSILSENKVDCIIMIDAGLKMEGETSGTVAHGFGAAIGGLGTERFQIEEIAVNKKIPIFAIVVKESVKEAITLMTKEIADSADVVKLHLDNLLRENTSPGQTILVIGVGNTVGVPQ